MRDGSETFYQYKLQVWKKEKEKKQSTMEEAMMYFEMGFFANQLITSNNSLQLK